MIEIVNGSLLVLCAVLATMLQRLYSSIPVKEVKRQARQGDQLAQTLYRAIAYGPSLRVLLWLIIIIMLPAGLLVILPVLPVAAAFVLLVILVATLFVWIPSMRLTLHTARLAAFAAPLVAGALSYLYSPLQRTAALISRHRALEPHSRLYEKQDLLDLLKLQKEQSDNRISHEELDLTQRALLFGDRLAADIARPRHSVQLINADESIGPVLLDQIHSSGQKVCLVYKGAKSNIIGSLHMSDAAAAKQGGRVIDLIRNDLIFIHEDFTLRQVLAAFQETGQHIAAVINKFEEFLGVVTFDALMEELLGELQVDMVSSYGDRRSVAAYEPLSGAAEEQQGQSEQNAEAIEESASPGATEVVK